MTTPSPRGIPFTWLLQISVEASKSGRYEMRARLQCIIKKIFQTGTH